MLKSLRVGRFCIYASVFLTGLTLLFGFLLSSSRVSADDTVVDEINITVPVSCSLTGVGMNSHAATINNGTYVSDIGTTTIKAYCNDKDGFAIYAIGYTDDIDGKNVMTSSTLGSTHDIATGTGTSGNNSQWAMKLSTQTNPEPTYPVTIQNNYNNYHTVPNDYDLVAKRISSTDIGAAAIGSTLTSTYQIYISNSQSAGTYVGQVKYVLVHPNTVPQPVDNDQVGVVFDGNGATFSGGAATNKLVYAASPLYVGTNPTIAKTSNLDNNGNKLSSYGYDEEIYQVASFPGAEKVVVEVTYGITADSIEVMIVEGEWDVDWGNLDNYVEINSGSSDISGSKTYEFDNDTVTVYGESWNTPESGYDYGFYIKVFPVYSTEQLNTEASFDYGGEVGELERGAYATTTTGWNGSWYANVNGHNEVFSTENELKSFIEDNISTLAGSNIVLYRSILFNESFVAANKTQSGGYYAMQDLDATVCASTALGQTITVKDIRDNNTYMVGKLKDGNCWMLDNLKLDPTDSTTAANMSSSNTNATAEAITNYLNGGSSNAGWSSVAVQNRTTNWRTYAAYHDPYVNNAYKSTAVTSYGIGGGKAGLYYNYCAATIGTYCYNGSDGIDVPDTIVDAPYDVCPANWRMPTGGSSGDYQTLYNKYSVINDATNTASLQYNLSAALSGWFYDDTTSRQNEWVYYWSSTVMDDDRVFLLKIEPDNVVVSMDLDSFVYAYPRYQGHPIRCIVSN